MARECSLPAKLLGDLAVFCPWPVETIERLRALPNVAFLRGNTDRYLTTGRRPAMPPVRSAEDWACSPAKVAERDVNFRWTMEQLSYADYGFLRDLPPRLEWEVPGYGRVVAVHANARDDETFLTPAASDDQVRAYFSGLDARLMLYGHTHCPVDRTMGGVRLVNGGSVGLPLDGDPRAAYVLLDFEHGGCAITQPPRGLRPGCRTCRTGAGEAPSAGVGGAEVAEGEDAATLWKRELVRACAATGRGIQR